VAYLKLENTLIDGRYEVRQWLAKGSYAEIFVAHDRHDGQQVIIKALNLRLSSEMDAELERTLIDNFQEEARILDVVRHPCVVRRLGHGEAVDLAGVTFPYLVMEFLGGGNLAAFCKRNGPLDLERTLFYFQQVVEGLAHAHAKSVVHRDLKPANLLLSETFQTIKIGDFGVATVGDGQTRVGTDVYAPPEHHPDFGAEVTGRQRLTRAADVYALAKTIYAVMTGQTPKEFSGAPISALPPALAATSYGNQLLRVLNKATATLVEHRYPTVEEFWEDFSRLAAWQDVDEATRVRVRPANSAPVAEPDSAPSAPKFHPPHAFEPNPLTPGTKVFGTEMPAAAPDRVVIPVQPLAAPVTPPAQATVPNITPSAPMRSVVTVPDIPPRINLEPPPAGPVIQSPPPAATPPVVPVQSPVQPSASAPAPPSPLVTKLIGAAVFLFIVVGFVGSMVFLYRTVRNQARQGGVVRPAPTTPADQLVPPFQAIVKSGVNVRSAPSSRDDGNKIGTLDSGVEVEVLEVQNGYYRIRPSKWQTRKSPDITEGWAYGTFFEVAGR
jgi:serine/threonine protein kinase